MVTHSDINPATLRAALAAEQDDVATAPPESVHNGDTGEVEGGNGVFLEADDTPAAETAPAVTPDETTETVTPPAAEEGDVEETKAKRFRLRPRTEQEGAIFQEMARDPHVSYEDAKARLFKKEEAAVATPAATETAPGATVIDSVALQAEIDALQDAADTAEADFDYELKREKIKELRAKERELRNFEKQKPAATALAEATPPAVDDTAYQAAYDADWSETAGTWTQLALPEAERAKDPLWIEMQAEHARMIASNDPALKSPRLNSLVAAKCAAKLKLVPGRAASPSATTPSTVPGPVNGGQRSGAVPRPVDTAALRQVLTPHVLAAALHGGH